MLSHSPRTDGPCRRVCKGLVAGVPLVGGGGVPKVGSNPPPPPRVGQLSQVLLQPVGVPRRRQHAPHSFLTFEGCLPPPMEFRGGRPRRWFQTRSGRRLGAVTVG